MPSVNLDEAIKAVHANPPAQARMAMGLLGAAQHLLSQSLAYLATPPAPTEGRHPSVPYSKEEIVRASPFNPRWNIPSEEWGGNMVITVEEGWFLYGLVRAVRPKRIVELGTNRGFSTLFLGGAVRDNGEGHVETVDITDWGQQGKLTERGLSPQWVTATIQNETAYIPKGPIDLLYHDSQHDYPNVLAALQRYTQWLVPGALVVVDDTTLCTDEQRAIREWLPSQSGVYLPTPCGMWIGRYLPP